MKIGEGKNNNRRCRSMLREIAVGTQVKYCQKNPPNSSINTLRTGSNGHISNSMASQTETSTNISGSSVLPNIINRTVVCHIIAENGTKVTE